MPPMHEIAHLAHVEVRTPVPEQSLEFFTGYLGLTATGSAGNSVFLRAWDDYEQTTIKLTAHQTSGVGRTSLRAASADALARRVKAVQASGRGVGWTDGDPGYGPTYVFTDPDGHEFGLYYESQRYAPSPELAPSLKNQAQAYPAGGVPVRRLDHINFLGAEVLPNRDYLCDTLGAMITEQVVLDDGGIAGSWTTFTNKGYDAVYTHDWTGARGRLHHVAFAADSRVDILRAADLALDHGVFIETGPHKHAIQQTFFLYVYEPGGNRIELCNAGARLVLAPDWQPVNWTEAERARGQAWGLKTIESFHTHGTPPVAWGPSPARRAAPRKSPASDDSKSSA
jgi:catechol 2,3-dioxygenase